jgi:Undecaprenyl-phosphate glucose phosphotransferase
LIVGDGKIARSLQSKIAEHSEYGLKVIGFISKDKESVGKEIDNLPVLGTYDRIKDILKERDVDQLILALPFEQIRLMKVILSQIYEEMIEIKIVPDFYEYFTLRHSIINLRESPLYGWNRVLKRTFDILTSLAILFLLSPFMLLIALLVKITSAGPVFYRQRRMGLDGSTFDIIKFRSMKIDAESDTGPVWAKENDRRRTRIGRLIRKFNLDELPQFLNVLRGNMSIVGPRPERPEFMDQFKKSIPEYMLRHKMKAGITGWAQINGMRGNTSIKQRTEYDLYYIENWSLFFDIKIFLKSFLALKNAY